MTGPLVAKATITRLPSFPCLGVIKTQRGTPELVIEREAASNVSAAVLTNLGSKPVCLFGQQSSASACRSPCSPRFSIRSGRISEDSGHLAKLGIEHGLPQRGSCCRILLSSKVLGDLRVVISTAMANGASISSVASPRGLKFPAARHGGITGIFLSRPRHTASLVWRFFSAGHTAGKERFRCGYGWRACRCASTPSSPAAWPRAGQSLRSASSIAASSASILV